MIDHPYAWLHPGRCKATVYKRDTFRYTGRTLSGFEMYYKRQQCSRKHGASGYCWQHVPRGTK